MPVHESEDSNTNTRMTAASQKINSGNYKKKDDEALNLDKFMSRAGPVVEALIDENSMIHFQLNKQEAAKHTAVELKNTLRIPEEILILLGKEGQMAQVEKIGAVHMFETMPQAKCAIAYEIDSP
jgi:hypothetical protein